MTSELCKSHPTSTNHQSLENLLIMSTICSLYLLTDVSSWTAEDHVAESRTRIIAARHALIGDSYDAAFQQTHQLRGTTVKFSRLVSQVLFVLHLKFDLFPDIPESNFYRLASFFPGWRGSGGTVVGSLFDHRFELWVYDMVSVFVIEAPATS